jgi:alkylation response protein AidB-like acyl-CoA dehydrogenase
LASREGTILHTRFSEQDLEFQQEVRHFLTENFTAELLSAIRTEDSFRSAMIEWQKILHRQGWSAPGWPVEYGGTGWTDTQRFIFEIEKSRLSVPDVVPFGLKMVGPVIYTFGTEEQRAYYLPRFLASDDWWCQGYSETGAGSDLASLQTRAVRDGDEYVINGAKIWTTYAQYSDWIFCLVRTDPKAERKQEGISFLLIDMTTPGITVNPIISIDGRHSLNEVEFNDVRVPIANLIGEENKGWTYAKALLAHERTAIAGVADSKREISLIKEYASRELANGRPIMQNPDFQRRLATVETELMALEYTELRVLASVSAGGAPGAESSILKIKGTEIQQAAQTLKMDLAGLYGGVLGTGLTTDEIGHDFGNRARIDYMYGRASTIYGGSNEVQKNIIAKAILGL